MTVLTYEQLNNHLTNILDGCFSFDPFLYDFFKNMYEIGCRANELFNLDKWSVKDENSMILLPEKKNNQRIISNEDLTRLFIHAVQTKPNLFYYWSYSQANMYFKRFSIYAYVYHDTRPETQNLFRHRKCKKMKIDGYTDQEIADYFGETEIKNIRNYIYSELKIL